MADARSAKDRSLGLRGRIVLAFVALLTCALLAILVIVDVASDQNVRDQVTQRLQISERVWAQLLDADADRLMESVSLLARDFAFREAVATGDDPTAQSALLNHGQRIHADVALLLEPSGALRGSVEGYDPAQVEAAFAPLLQQAERAGQATDVVMLDGQPYLVAVVPVLAPRRIAWAGIGVRYGEAFARHYRAVVGLDVAFIEPHDGRIDVRASTLPAPQRMALSRLGGEPGEDVALAGRHYAVREFQAADTPQGAIRILLLADLEEAMQATATLKRQILGLTAVAAAIALLLAVAVGRGISRPVAELAEAARRVGDGDYAELPVRGHDELAQLARAFNAMQAGIAQREVRIGHQASHDALTDLPNRSFALRHLDLAIAQARIERISCAVLMIDLNRFKEVNDSLGHAFGDELLQVVARRLQGTVGDADLIARLGGDEFLVVMEGAGADEARARALALVATLDAPFAMSRAQVSLDASAGVAVFPEHADDAASLLRRADIAMYEAKVQHARVSVYASGHDEHHLRQVSLMGELRFAQERGQLSLAFQPKIELRTGRVAHVEALLRWSHPQFGRIGPDEFIPLAERSGVIGALTRFVLDEGLRIAAPWIRAGLVEGVAINLSPFDLLDHGLPAYVGDRLRAHGIEGRRLILEVTESTAMRDLATSMQTMQALRGGGVRMSIDDFGTGHSSLSHLRSLPVDEIKIDKSFIMALGGAHDDSVIVRSAIEIGHNMGLSVIAEGVEDANILRILRALGCDMVQGYLFSAPLSAEDFVAWHGTYTRREAVG